MRNKQDSGSPADEEAAAGTRDAAEGGDAPSGPATLEDARLLLEELRAAVAERDDDLARIRDQFLRERADLENFKKRMTREKSEALRYASEALIRELLPVLDNLERALGATEAPSGGPAAALHEGVAMVAHQMEEILGRFGVARVEASDQPFNPNEHEALAHVETTLKEPGAVLDEHRPGYRLHDRLLRAAQVTVAKAPTGEGN